MAKSKEDDRNSYDPFVQSFRRSQIDALKKVLSGKGADLTQQECDSFVEVLVALKLPVPGS